jgi:rhodanese-related sulfurtransferase
MVKEIDSIGLVEKLKSDENTILLDIRGANELVQGILPGSQHLPMHMLPLRISEFPKDKEIVLYCRSGARSYNACYFLMQQGFDNVINLRGGIMDWAQKGLEIELPSKACCG